jgi:hypothetical protein
MSEWLSPVSTEPAAAPSSRRPIAELAAVEELRLDVLEPDDVSRPYTGQRRPRLGQRAFELPLVPQVDVEERRADPDLLDGREPVAAAGPGAAPVPVRQHVEAVRRGDERVRRPGRQVDEAGPRADLADDVLAPLAALPRQARASEHEEDLLVVAVGVERCRAAARMDADAVYADANGAGSVAQVPPRRMDASLLVVVLFDVVPVRDVGMTHAASIRAPCGSTQGSTATVGRSPNRRLAGPIRTKQAEDAPRRGHFRARLARSDAGADLFVPRRRTRGGLRRLPAMAAPAVVGTCEG